MTLTFTLIRFCSNEQYLEYDLPRPRKPRFVSGFPTMTAFVPEGLPVTGEVSLTLEELEAIR
ncbi:MAG: DUF134 domain-containing protein, partial [Deltaproteobacteria bacterium]